MIRRIIIAVVLIGAATGITLGVSRLQPALPTVEASTVWPDTVKRGPMLRQVHGLGSLVPEDVVWISSVTDGRIEKIYVQPGTMVKPDTIIMELSNPTLSENSSSFGRILTTAVNPRVMQLALKLSF